MLAIMDWRTPPPSGAFPASREGLPPCIIRAARLDDRMAWWSEANRCECWATDAQVDVAFGVCRPPISTALCRDWCISALGNARDPDEAQAAFERGAEWVRTGHIS